MRSIPLSHLFKQIAVILAIAVTAFGFTAISTRHAAKAEAWENCGDYICTTYYDRAQTRAIAQYLNETAGGAEDIATGICGIITAGIGVRTGFVGAILAGAGGAALCDRIINLDDWVEAANNAVNDNGCLQMEYGTSRLSLSRMAPAPGYTTHPDYCFD